MASGRRRESTSVDVGKIESAKKDRVLDDNRGCVEKRCLCDDNTELSIVEPERSLGHWKSNLYMHC